MKTFRKRLISLLLVFILLISYCSLLASCGDGYKIVCSIEYSVDGVEKTEYSTVYASMSVLREVSMDYYYSADGKKLSQFPAPERLYPNSRTVTNLGELDESDVNNIVYEMAYSPFGSAAWECKFHGFKYNYIRVKEKGDNVIAIKNADGLSEYMVDYYTITYFDD